MVKAYKKSDQLREGVREFTALSKSVAEQLATPDLVALSLLNLVITETLQAVCHISKQLEAIHRTLLNNDDPL